jgi:hypothetical protein
MLPEEKQKIDEYVNSFESPAELSFFNEKQKNDMDLERRKLEASRTFVASIAEQADFDSRFQKATLEGRIFAPSQAINVDSKIRVVDGMDGARLDIQETLVSRSGQRLIMSGRLQQILGFITDSYMTKDEAGQLASALQADGVPGPEIDRVNAAVNKFGAVMLQRGIFVALKGMLEDAIGHSLPIYNPAQNNALVKSASSAAPSAQPKQGSELPAGFIEYLKNNDKEFDRVEHEIAADPKFQEFFSNLQKHYTYYQNLPSDRMAHEIILRPQLWNKLSPQTRVWIQNLVERNRQGFQSKVEQVAVTSGASKLDELKKSIAK